MASPQPEKIANHHSNEDLQPYAALKTPRDEELLVEVSDDTDVTASRSEAKSHTSADGERTSLPLSRFRFAKLYRFATRLGLLLLGGGIAMSILRGAMDPLITYVFGDIISVFTESPVNQKAVDQAAFKYLIIAAVVSVTEYVAYVVFFHSAERQMKQLRTAALRQRVAALNTAHERHDDDQDGMGSKLGNALKSATYFVVGFTIGFAKGWDIALVAATVLPSMVFGLFVLFKKLAGKAKLSQKLSAEAGAIAEETLGAILTVASLNGEKHAVASYKQKTKDAEMLNTKFARFVALGFLWRSHLDHVRDRTLVRRQEGLRRTQEPEVLTHIQQSMMAVAESTGAALALFKILDTKSEIDASKVNESIIPTKPCERVIEAMNVCFAYPSRPDALVLKNYTVSIQSDETVAFVSASGGGKTTLVSLLERFYDPISGALYLDGRDIKTLNVKWLRSQIGPVSQEPVLFAATIFANIAAGGGRNGDLITHEQVVRTAKLANAHDFTMSLPEQYDAEVGEKGLTLSGGQQQRIVIARAILKKPAILVLDEAASALDSMNEQIVQEALDSVVFAAHERRTTMTVIAHHLSTIQNADKICVLDGSV